MLPVALVPHSSKELHIYVPGSYFVTRNPGRAGLPPKLLDSDDAGAIRRVGGDRWGLSSYDGSKPHMQIPEVHERFRNYASMF
jgi:hypothetical protein